MTSTVHTTEIHHEPPSRSGILVLLSGHRATCSCGWSSDCYSQLDDTQRAIEVHLRRVQREDFDALLARSSIGVAIADIQARGIDAHVADLEKTLWRRRKRQPQIQTHSNAVKNPGPARRRS